MNHGQRTLRVIVFQEHGMWVAQGLELDIATQGKDLAQLRERFDLTLHAELEAIGDLDPAEAIGPAPKEFFERWEQLTFKGIPEPEYQMALCA